MIYNNEEKIGYSSSTGVRFYKVLLSYRLNDTLFFWSSFYELCVRHLVALRSYHFGSYFLKRTINEADRHDKEIKEIQLSYVTKDELKDIKTDVNKSIGKLQTDVEQIKENCLTKKDYYNSINEVKDEIKTQNKLILELLRGGNNND